MTKNGPIFADELMAKMQADPEFVARRAEQDREMERQQRELEAAQRPLLEDLRGVGWDLRTVWELVNTSAKYPEAVPILLDHLLNGDYPDRVRQGIARSLAAPFARSAYQPLKRLYEERQSPGLQEAIAAALNVLASKEDLPDILGFLRDRSFGWSRVLLIATASRLVAVDEREALLIEWQADPQLEVESTYRLKRRRRSQKNRS
jgi:hypothetical protein